MSAASDDVRVFALEPARQRPPQRWVAGARAALAAASAPLGRAAGGLILPLLVLALWWTASQRHWVPEQLLPAPPLVWQTLHELWASGDLLSHLGFSAARVGWSLVIGGSIGLALGFGLALSPLLRAYVLPSFKVVAQFPVLGWVPLLIIFAGIDEALKISAISIAVVVPMTLNTWRAVAAIPPHLLEVARVHRFSLPQVLWRVVLPAAAPGLFTGLRQAVMQAWLSLVFVELLASSEGIGYLIVWGRQLAQPDLVVAGMVVIGAVGLLLDAGLRWLEGRLQGWRHGAF
ncbi:MAG TPA: ABC transporter permease [Albitalea sp.]|uniref:ABC transporter permease n=1 Tax=Piscinibacter sp. TaxID=1903157 RepID=UPI002ED15D04